MTQNAHWKKELRKMQALHRKGERQRDTAIGGLNKQLSRLEDAYMKACRRLAKELARKSYKVRREIGRVQRVSKSGLAKIERRVGILTGKLSGPPQKAKAAAKNS